MSEFKGYRETSRTNWGTSEPGMSLDQINCGALLRIADATELMAKRYSDLIDERDNYKRWYEQERDAKHRRDRRINALRGQITKLKKRLVDA
jgi:hypothetical protein